MKILSSAYTYESFSQFLKRLIFLKHDCKMKLFAEMQIKAFFSFLPPSQETCEGKVTQLYS